MLHRFDRIRLDGALALALAAALLVIPCAAGQAQAAEAQEAAPDDRLGKLEKELEKTRSELAALKAAQAAPTEARLAELERRIEILAQEIEALKIGEAAAPEPGAHVPGLGPAASKVYALKKGVSIGGYGEVLYQNYASHRQDGAPSDATDTIDLARAVVYLGYKFDSRFVLNTEIEYEHAVAASDKEGEVEVEFAYLDYALRRSLSFRAGLVLVPMGLVNELHEPPTYLGARRPDVETVIIPSTWRELGFGAYGDLGPVTYRAYLVNGLNAAGYTAEGITEGRQEGSLARAHDFAFTLRADVTAVPGAVLGASVFTGDSGQGQTTPEGEEISASTTVWDLHAEWRYRGLQLRGLFARSTVGEADKVNRLNRLSGDASVGSRQQGWYLEAGYDVLSLVQGARASLVPFLRYEEYDTQADVPDGFERNPENDVTQLTLGAAFKPIDAIVVKLDWQRRHDAAGTGVNQFNVALGYIF